MEALVLCGGFAKRLEPIGEFIPKALLTLNGIPLADYIVSDLEREKDITSITISTNLKFADQFKYWLKLKKMAGLSKEVKLVIEPATSNENKFGAVKGIAYDIKKAHITDDLIVIAGDNFYTFELSKLIRSMLRGRMPAIVVYDVRSKESAKRFGVVKVGKGGVIKEFEEKPEKPHSTLVSTGIYFFPKSMLKYFDEYLESSQNTDNIGDFVKWLAEKQQVHAIIPSRGEWFDIGTIDGYREIFHRMKKLKDSNIEQTPHI